MRVPVKSEIGLISSSSSRRPSRWNQAKESSCIWMRCGISRTCAIFAYDFLLAGTHDRVLTMSVGTVIYARSSIRLPRQYAETAIT
jgi:hypothetical protein